MVHFKQTVATLALLAIAAVPLWAADSTSPVQVLPWNGYKAAISLTFDDGDPCHLDIVAPEFIKRGLKGTFYLIAGKFDRKPEWQKFLASGQEIGNHTLEHKHVSEFKEGEAQKQVEEAKKILETTFGVPVLTFAYPFVEITPELKKWVLANNFIARGGGGADFYMTPDLEPDWGNIPSQMTMTAMAYDLYQSWVDQDLASESWTVLMIHGIEGTPWGYQPIPKKIFLQLLDYLVEKQKTLWAAPFREVGGYWMAQKTFEKSKPKQDGTTVTWNWEKPANFPTGVVLKVQIAGTGLKVSQGGTPLKATSLNTYLVSFDAKELTVEGATWKVGAIKTPVGKGPGISVVKSQAPTGNVLKIDDFETDQSTLGTVWWTGSDTNNLGTTLAPNPFVRSKGGSPKSPGYCAGIKGHLGSARAPWPWAFLSLSLDPAGKPMDLTAYKSIRFYTKGSGSLCLVALNRLAVKDYADFTATFTPTDDWTQVTIALSDFAQANWGAQLPKVFNDVEKLTFSPKTNDADYDFKIDDIEFVK